MPIPMAVHPVDLKPFISGTAADRIDVAEQIDIACRDSGFLMVTGHGIAASTCDGALDAFAAFFDSPVDDKRACVVADESANRGYSELGKEALAYSRGDVTPPDLFEAFNMGREETDGAYFDRHRSFYAPNAWPAFMPELRTAWLTYERAASEVVDILLRAFAMALHLPDAWFVDRCRRAIVTTRAINYARPAGAPDPEPGQMRLGAHTDYGIVTLLLADDAPGLQVFRDGDWHDVQAPPGALIVNIGDMLERWTNDRWTSTLHRVTPPPSVASGPVRRRSIARFLDCEPDLVVACIPSCTSASNPPRYPPVPAGEWLRAKVLGGRTQQPVMQDQDVTAPAVVAAGVTDTGQADAKIDGRETERMRRIGV